MQIIENPRQADLPRLLARPALESESLAATVAEIMADVREWGDAAVRKYTQIFDKVSLAEFVVNDDEFVEAESSVPEELKNAIATARVNIERFHTVPSPSSEKVETTPGVYCWRRQTAIERVGLYVPAGTAPLFSTVLMLAVPARLAGCSEIVMCSPANAEGRIDATTLYAARECGVTRVYKIGGAQAIAAMTFGTETIQSVFKVFGPGNQYVTEAKLQATRFGVAIDMPAGPSEVAVIADETCVPAFVAADLLSQAEHGPDSQVLLAATSRQVIDDVLSEVDRQVADLPRRDIALAALANSRAFLLSGLDAAIELINLYAPEHLIIATRDAESAAAGIQNAGSVFIGNYSCESAGDYASGTNHTLPTNGYARAFSGVSTASFTKTITFQEVTPTGICQLGPVIETMAAAERLEAHKRAVSIRLSKLGGGDGV